METYNTYIVIDRYEFSRRYSPQMKDSRSQLDQIVEVKVLETVILKLCSCRKVVDIEGAESNDNQHA